MSYDDSYLNERLDKIANSLQFGSLPGGGWMATSYWGDDENPFDPEWLNTVPIAGWQVQTHRPPEELGDATTYLTPIFPTYPLSTATYIDSDAVNLGPGQGQIIWHPDNVASDAVPASPEDAERILRAAHAWWPVEKMTITDANTYDYMRDQLAGWALTVQDESGERETTIEVGVRRLSPAFISALGVSGGPQNTGPGYREQCLKLPPESFIGLHTWGQFKTAPAVPILGLNPPENGVRNTYLKT